MTDKFSTEVISLQFGFYFLERLVSSYALQEYFKGTFGGQGKSVELCLKGSEGALYIAEMGQELSQGFGEQSSRQMRYLR